MILYFIYFSNPQFKLIMYSFAFENLLEFDLKLIKFSLTHLPHITSIQNKKYKANLL